MKEKTLSFISAHKKILIIIASCAVLGAAILTTVLLYVNQNKASNTATYREYSATKGNVTVGTSESGTVTLDQVTVSFPVDVTIDSVLVKPGYEVKSGEALVKLNQNSITDSTADSINKLATAKISLQQALADQTNKVASYAKRVIKIIDGELFENENFDTESNPGRD